MSREIARIVALERAPDDVEEVLRLVGCVEGYALRDVQIRALSRIAAARGGLFPIGVGFGKFLISVLAPTVLRCTGSALLLVPPALVVQTRNEIEIWKERVSISPALVVMSYGRISTVEGKGEIERLRPDVIVADEAHLLRRRESARTRRVLRYFLRHEETRFVALSGTLLSRSLSDASHLSELALRDLSPIPRLFSELRSFSRVIDVRPDEPPTAFDRRRVEPLLAWSGETDPRRAFFRRLETAPGVLVTKTSAFGASLEVYLHPYDLDPELEEALRVVVETWTSPDGVELSSPMDVARVTRQLLSGYFTRWKWPEGVVDVPWLEARNEWSRVCREYLKRNRQDLDTPFEVVLAVREGRAPSHVSRAWEAWEVFADTPPPPVVPVWISRSPVDFLRGLVGDEEVGLIWTESPFVLDALQDVQKFGAGEEPPTSGERTVALSRRAFGVGRNLQRYELNASLGLPPSGTAVEQTMGRTHRPGSEADVVTWRVAIPRSGIGREFAKKSLQKILEDCRFVESLGQKTKALSAVWVEK